jgi:hypothetical protein
MMRKIAIGLVAAVIATAGSTLSASAGYYGRGYSHFGHRAFGFHHREFGFHRFHRFGFGHRFVHRPFYGRRY